MNDRQGLTNMRSIMDAYRRILAARIHPETIGLGSSLTEIAEGRMRRSDAKRLHELTRRLPSPTAEESALNRVLGDLDREVDQFWSLYEAPVRAWVREQRGSTSVSTGAVSWDLLPSYGICFDVVIVTDFYYSYRESELAKPWLESSPGTRAKLDLDRLVAALQTLAAVETGVAMPEGFVVVCPPPPQHTDNPIAYIGSAPLVSHVLVKLMGYDGALANRPGDLYQALAHATDDQIEESNNRAIATRAFEIASPMQVMNFGPMAIELDLLPSSGPRTRGDGLRFRQLCMALAITHHCYHCLLQQTDSEDLGAVLASDYGRYILHENLLELRAQLSPAPQHNSVDAAIARVLQLPELAWASNLSWEAAAETRSSARGERFRDRLRSLVLAVRDSDMENLRVQDKGTARALHVELSELSLQMWRARRRATASRRHARVRLGATIALDLLATAFPILALPTKLASWTAGGAVLDTMRSSAESELVEVDSMATMLKANEQDSRSRYTDEVQSIDIVLGDALIGEETGFSQG